MFELICIAAIFSVAIAVGIVIYLDEKGRKADEKRYKETKKQGGS